MTANPSFTGAGPDDIRIGRRNGQRSDGRYRLSVKDRFPVNTAIGGLENSARRGSGVIDIWLTRHADDRSGAIADGTYVSPAHRVGVGRLRMQQRDEECDRNKSKKGSDEFGHLESSSGLQRRGGHDF